MRRAIALVAILAVALAVPVTADAKKKHKTVRITLSSWQVVMNDDGQPVNAANHGTFTYCSTDRVTHIYAVGKAKPTKKGRKFSITWKRGGKKVTTLKGYKTGSGGSVLAPLHKKDNSGLADGTWKANWKHGKKKSSIAITLQASSSACG